MKTSKNFKLVLADDHVLLRDALGSLIDKFAEFTVVDKVANGQELIETITNGIKPDILLMDLNMPKWMDNETARWVTKHHPEIKIVILTMYDTEVIATDGGLRLSEKGYTPPGIKKCTAYCC